MGVGHSSVTPTKKLDVGAWAWGVNIEGANDIANVSVLSSLYLPRKPAKVSGEVVTGSLVNSADPSAHFVFSAVFCLFLSRSAQSFMASCLNLSSLRRNSKVGVASAAQKDSGVISAASAAALLLPIPTLTIRRL